MSVKWGGDGTPQSKYLDSTGRTKMPWKGDLANNMTLKVARGNTSEKTKRLNRWNTKYGSGTPNTFKGGK